MIQGEKSVQFAITGAGTGTATFTISSANLSTYQKARFWWKLAKNNGTKINAFKFRLGQNSSNYFEREVSNIGFNFEDHRSLESVLLNEPKNIVGSPNLSAVVFVQYYFDFNAGTTSNAIHLDILQAFNG